MLVGKIKSEEDLLENGFKVVDECSNRILYFAVTHIAMINMGPDKGKSNGFAVWKKQGTIPYIVFKDNDHILHGKLDTLVRLLNNNEYRFYY